MNCTVSPHNGVLLSKNHILQSSSDGGFPNAKIQVDAHNSVYSLDAPVGGNPATDTRLMQYRLPDLSARLCPCWME